MLVAIEAPGGEGQVVPEGLAFVGKLYHAQCLNNDLLQISVTVLPASSALYYTTGCCVMFFTSKRSQPSREPWSKLPIYSLVAL